MSIQGMATAVIRRLWQLNDCLSSKSAVKMFATSAVGSRHLAKGDKLPQQNADTLRIFSMKYSPTSIRVRLVLAAKGIQYETINCNLKYKPEFLLERNPTGRVPVLEYKGQVVYESLIVSDLIEELFPQRPLYPTDPFSKAKDKVIIQFFDSFTSLLWKMIRFRDGMHPDKTAQFFEGLQRMKDELQSRGTAYFSGSKPGMVDYMCWPYFERLSSNQSILSNYPTIQAYIERMSQDDAVKAVYIHVPHKEATAFWLGLYYGNPVYDPE